jgi:hypothetical protein
MTIEEKLKINKDIRGYKGDNYFLISLQKTLKGKYASKVDHNGKMVKVLSDKQYESALIGLS